MKMKVAILDDYADAILSSVDFSLAQQHAEITVFNEPFAPQNISAGLGGFDVICAMRERTPFARATFEALPNLKALITSDAYIRTIDFDAAEELGIKVIKGATPNNMPLAVNSTGEFAWGLLLATVRQIPAAVERLRQGEWWHPLGMSLEGKTLGIVGLGRYGAKMAEYARTFDMNVIAWSQNLTDEHASELGVLRVDKDTLFRESDIVTVHYVLSDRTHGLIGAHELGLMKPTSYILNTSRGQIIDEGALITALKEKRIAGAGLDVFDQEPLPKDHPLLQFDNVVATPHLGFVTEPAMRVYYVAIAEALNGFIQQQLDMLPN